MTSRAEQGVHSQVPMRLSRREFIGATLKTIGGVAGIVGVGGIFIDSSIAPKQARTQAQAENPNPVSSEDLQNSEQVVQQTDRAIVKLANQQRYDKIPHVVESPARLSAEAKIQRDKKNQKVIEERYKEIMNDTSIGNTPRVRGFIYLASYALAIPTLIAGIAIDLFGQDRHQQETPQTAESK